MRVPENIRYWWVGIDTIETLEDRMVNGGLWKPIALRSFFVL
jgi:hypothetical protein